MASPPIIIAIGGPNGAGKTTISRELLAETLGITTTPPPSTASGRPPMPTAKPKPRARKPRTPAEIIRDGALIDAAVIRAVRQVVGPAPRPGSRKSTRKPAAAQARQRRPT